MNTFYLTLSALLFANLLYASLLFASDKEVNEALVKIEEYEREL